MKQIDKVSITPGVVPLPSDLAPGEICVNSEDKKIYLFKDDGNHVVFEEQSVSIHLVTDLAARNALTDLKNGDFVKYDQSGIRFLEVWMTDSWSLVERTAIPKLKYTFHSAFRSGTASIRFYGGRMRMKKGSGGWAYYNPGTTYNLPSGGAAPVIIEEEYFGEVSSVTIDNSTNDNMFVGAVSIEGGYEMASISNLFWDWSQITSIDMTGFYAPKATTGTNTFRACYKLKCITNLDTTTLNHTTAAKNQMFIGCNAMTSPTQAERNLMTADHGYSFRSSNPCP